VSAQEVERRRLERDLHDGAQQEIVALMAKLRLARNRLSRGDQVGLDELLDEVQADARSLLEELRELAHGIRPPVLADRGLVGAIEARAARLPIDVAIAADPALRAARYDDDVEGAAWFAVSELCANALKHSGASRLVITVEEARGRLHVTVTDDGCGIPQQRTETGLRGLRDRLEALDGRLRVTGRPGEGTQVGVSLPARRRIAADA
jgi:signal transduction histidine kinase